MDGIILWPLGGFALCGPTDEFVGGDLKVALAGPMTHIPMTLLWWTIYVAVKGEGSGMWPSPVIYADTLSSSAAGYVLLIESRKRRRLRYHCFFLHLYTTARLNLGLLSCKKINQLLSMPIHAIGVHEHYTFLFQSIYSR